MNIFPLNQGDKCGNLYLYSIPAASNFSELGENLKECSNRLTLLKPIQSFQNLVKDKLPISSIYSIESGYHNYQVVCCCKDGFYRVFEFNMSYYDDMPTDDSFTDTNHTLNLINKYQINSYVDLIESFLFDDDLGIADSDCFDLESNLRLALCFYGDKFLLWNFQLNRALFEFKCGGANRSWDFELYKTPDGYLFRFIFLKDRKMCEFSKVLSEYELKTPVDQANNHFCQIFHGNTITVVKSLPSTRCFLTGGEGKKIFI